MTLQTSRMRGFLRVNSYYLTGALVMVIQGKPQFVTEYGSRSIERRTAARLLRHWRKGVIR